MLSRSENARYGNREKGCERLQIDEVIPILHGSQLTGVPTKNIIAYDCQRLLSN